MVNGEDAITVTVHRMVRKLDAGEVIAERRIPLSPGESLDRAIREAKREGARLLVDVLRSFRQGTPKGAAVDLAEAHYYPFPRATDVRKFRARGYTLL